MTWKDLRIGMKLGIGFGALLLLVVVGGLVGYNGLKTVGHALTVVGDEEAPLIDAANEMKISLMAAVTSMDEFRAATAALATDDQGQLAAIEKTYRQTLAEFDVSADAILQGGTLTGGVKVVKTDNNQLADLVRQTDELHNNKYQPASEKMMAEGRKLLARKAATDAAMLAMEGAFDEVTADVGSMEGMVRDELVALTNAGHIGAAAQTILREEVPLADMVNEVKYTLAMTRITLEEYVQGQDLAELKELGQEYQQWIAAFDQVIGAILDGGTVDGVQIIATDNTQLRDAVAEVDQNHAVFQKVADEMMVAHQATIAQGVAADEAMALAEIASDEATALLDKVEKLAGQEMAAAKTMGQESSSRAITWQLIVVGSSLLIGGLLGFVITRAISGPIRKGVAMADEIAKGDFSQRLNLNQKDEIGQLALALDGMAANLQQKADIAEKIADGNLNITVELASEKDQLGLSLRRMTDSLNDILGQIQTAAEQIATGGGQVSDASQSLSQGATEAAASLEQITSSMNVMAGQTRENAENSLQANQLSDEARDSAAKGNDQMQSMVSAMVEINDASQNISRIIKTIDEIAFQTNLLALNAAVEAARAGQHGKGFAVVAEEVRNLAARSAKAAEETAELIEGSVQKTSNGTQIANQTAEALQGILGGIGKVRDLVSEISASSSEQADGIAQVDIGLTQIDQVTQQNTASAEESAAAAEELASQADSLRHLLTRFTLRQNASSHLRPPATPKTPMSKVGWTDVEQQSSAGAAPGYQQTQISLDDGEFGKY